MHKQVAASFVQHESPPSIAKAASLETPSIPHKVVLMVGIGSTLVIACLVIGCLMDRCLSKRKKPKHARLAAPSDANDVGRSPRNSPRSSPREKAVSGCSKNDAPRTKAHATTGKQKITYEWNQTDSAASVFLRVPDSYAYSATKKDLTVEISKNRLVVGCVDKPPLLVSDTWADLNLKESMWRFRSNGELQILLQKVEKVEWPKVLLRPKVPPA